MFSGKYNIIRLHSGVHMSETSHTIMKNFFFNMVVLLGALLFLNSCGDSVTVNQTAACPPGRPSCGPSRAATVTQGVTVHKRTTFALVANGVGYRHDLPFRGGFGGQRFGGGGQRCFQQQGFDPRFGGRPGFSTGHPRTGTMHYPPQGPPGSPGGAYRVGGIAGHLQYRR